MAQFIVKSFDVYPYVIDKHYNIWKYTDRGYFLKVSPWENGEDRRVNKCHIEELIKRGKLTQCSAKSTLFEKLNKKWDECGREWEHNGEHFCVDIQGNNGNDFYKAPIHKFPHTYKGIDGNKHTYCSEYRIVFFNGNIYWATPHHYWPQVQLYKFESVDKEPETKINSYFRWTNGYHLRPIYSVNRGEYI